MRFILLLQLLLISHSTFSQSDNDYPDFKRSSLIEIIQNENWNILLEAEGDLNSDRKTDKVLLLESVDSIAEKRCKSCYRLNNKARIILVLLKNDTEYSVISQNNDFIARSDEGGMLQYLEPVITIEDNELKIFYQYVRSNRKYAFRYVQGSLEIKYSKSVGVQASSGNYRETHIDFINQIVTIKKGHISTDPENDKIETIPFNIKPKKLEDFGTINSWELVDNIYL